MYMYNWASGSEPTYSYNWRALSVSVVSVVQIPYSSKCFYVNLFKRHGHKMRPYNAHAYAPSKYFTTRVQLCMCMIGVCLRRTVYFADACYLGQDRDTVVNYARAYA